MTGPDDAFRARLLDTFREEAGEYLESITGGLIELEKSGLEPATVEAVYRRVHSLKGAARAVNLREIESVCQTLESVFSLVKRGEYAPGLDDFDLFHRTLAVVKALLEGERPPAPSSEIIGALRAILDRRKPAAVQKTVQTPRENGAPPAPADRAGGTVRIAAQKLDRLTAGADGLLTTRIALAQRVRELEEMTGRFTFWHWNHSHGFSDLNLIRRRAFGEEKGGIPPDLVLPLQRVFEFLEYNREFVISLQHDLAAHVREMEIDRAALEAGAAEISDLVHDAALLPASSVLAPFSAFVREFSRTSGKSVELVVEGGEIEVDRRILDALREPIMHLIRNSIDHGIEDPATRAAQGKPASGTVRIRVFPRSGSRVGIEVADDGAGIDSRAIRQTAVDTGMITPGEDAALTDSEAVWLIFRSGLTTSRVVTELSGRGLGLAIVEDSVSRLGGKVTVSSAPGKGTAITLSVPVRMTTLRGLLVRAERQVYVLPMQQVKQVLRVRPDSLALSRGRPTVQILGEAIEVIRLTDALGIPGSAPQSGEVRPMPIVIIAYGAGQIACMVDEVIRVQEIAVRPLGAQLRSVRRIEGAVVLGDGRVALVLDPLELIQDAMQAERPLPLLAPPGGAALRILVVEDSVTSRVLLQEVLEGAGYLVETAVDGIDALGRLKEYEFDMVISDVDMPRMNGFTLTEKIRAGDQNRIPVVLVTSLDSPEDRAQGMAVGADAYIVKSSFKTGDFLRTIRRLVRRPGAGEGVNDGRDS